MSPVDAIRNYFESMVSYRISSIISTLSRLQVHLLSNKDKLTMQEMDAEINRLEDIRRLLVRQLTPNWISQAPPPPPPQKIEKKQEPET
jgi:hypothetical protein